MARRETGKEDVIGCGDEEEKSPGVIFTKNHKSVKLIHFCQLETESHDTSKCTAAAAGAATSDIIGGHMLQQREEGRRARQRLDFPRTEFYTFEKLIAMKMIQLICVATSHVFQRRGREHFGLRLKKIVLHFKVGCSNITMTT